MRSRRLTWILVGLLCLAGALLLWQGRDGSPLEKVGTSRRDVRSDARAVRPYLSTASTNAAKAIAAANTNKFAYRLANTTKSIDQLLRDDKAILLENALIDTRNPLNLSIPTNLRAQGDAGAYIVQARGPIDNTFRAMLTQAGATIVSYIPNNAYLVRLSQGSANGLAGNPLTQAVIPYEPYYKIQSSLLGDILQDQPLPPAFNVAAFPNTANEAKMALEKAGWTVMSQQSSPFGEVFTVQGRGDVVALAQMPSVQIIEPSYSRVTANDLSRATTGVAADTQIPTNYLGLTGSNVIVEVNDSGIDATHPDFKTGISLPVRVIGDAPQSLVDTNGHGTHVAGIIAGNGFESTTVTNASGSTLVGGKGSVGQFRGKAPLATLYSVGGVNGGADTNVITDSYLQEVPARTNALISNNSWNYGDSSYDLAAASYDAAVRDALPERTGSQPVLFVFSAGNSGNGDDSDDPGGGTADSIQSPATAKNVITVGALQEFRDITNTVTNADNSVSAPWDPETSTSYRVAGFSSRGNVGIGTEGAYGRYKPDVVAPGTFVISTRSSQWDIGTYFYQSPTNYDVLVHPVVVPADSRRLYVFPLVPTNTIQVTIQLEPNADSPDPFPTNLPIYFALIGAVTYSGPVINQLSTPYGGLTIANILSTEYMNGFNYAVSNVTSEPINFDIVLDTITTNNPGNYFLVLSNLDQSIGTPSTIPGATGPGPYYRYETGTSMSAADVSGVLALMQDYFTNQWRTLPSPALLKAMLINGARQTGYYDFQVQNSINYEGWGLVNLPDSLPPGTITNQLNVPCSAFIQDQNPTNALATGDSQTFHVTTTNTQPLRVTLAWTDPPGNPAAAIKLVNDLNLVVTNLDDPANLVVYYGNDIAGGTFNSAGNTNAPNFDSINNVENVYLPAGAGTSFSVTVVGYRVNVNAVTAQTNNFAGAYAPNVVQDYALVISSCDGSVANAMTVTTNSTSFVSNPTSDQQITYVSGATNNGPLLNQFVSANTPLMGTNAISMQLVNSSTTNALNGVTNWQVTIGMTNQWHFYVVTASTNSAFTNAAFVTFIPDTLSIPRMGVFANSQANATRPQADIDLYVAGPNDPNASSLTNLDPMVISNCVNGLNGDGASFSRGGTEFVAYSNSAPGQVYYIGVKSESQMASEYDFISIFSATPFSQLNPNGSQTVNGLPMPVDIPDGSPAHPGSGFVFGLALYPMEVGRVVVTNQVWHQNFGDLIGTLTLNGEHPDVLNNHDSFVGAPGPYYLTYDDSQRGDIVGSRLSDGPGSLNDYLGLQGIGVWRLTEVDDAHTQIGVVQNLILTIEPHQDLTKGITNFVQPGEWFYSFIDVPLGATNLTINATNVTSSSPLQLYVKLGAEPTAANYDYETNLAPGGSISIGPPLTSGRYFVGVFNPSDSVQDVYIIATIGMGAVPGQWIYPSTDTPVPILDDAVTTDSISVPVDATISSVDVGVSVQHPRISDLVFHLISPDGTRVLLMENRGGTDTNGAGAMIMATNAVTTNWQSSFEGGSGTFFVVNAQGYVPEGWYVNSGYVGVLSNGCTPYSPFGGGNAYDGNYYYIDLNGMISTNIPIVADQTYTLSFAYAPDPDSIANHVVPSADIWVDGKLLTNFSATVSNTWAFLNWQTTSYVFTAAPSYPHTLAFSNNVGGGGGVLLDGLKLEELSLSTNSTYLVFTENTNLTTTPIKFAPPPFTATNDLFYLPEQPLDSFVGLDALGPWTLEIQDDRAGATNPAPTLAGWQLRFNFSSFATAPTPWFLTTNPPPVIMDVDELTTFMVTNTAIDADTNKTLIYLPPIITVDTNAMNANGWPLNYVGTVPAPVVSTIGTNSVITWIPSEAQGPGVYDITNVVYVYGTPSARATNGFTVTVNEVNVPPVFLFPTNTTVFNIYQSFPFSANCVAMDPDIPLNPLTFALVSESMAGLTVSTNGVINWTPLQTGTNVVTISVTDINPPAVNQKSFSVTNSFTIVVTVITNPPTGPMSVGRFGHTATLLPNGKVLVAGGYIASAELYDPASGTWTNTGSMSTARAGHTATLLQNGKVLVAGGVLGGSPSSMVSTELYDPASGTWTLTGSLVTARASHTATLLPNGKVLVAGGTGSGGPLASAELYDPTLGTWAPAGTMFPARDSHTATLLTNGQVLIAGGNNNGPITNAELYDPALGTWTATGPMTAARNNHTATLLPNGKVLVAGGVGSGSSSELYDPTLGTWKPTGSLNTARYFHTATLLPNGQVLVIGGFASSTTISLSSSELYDPASGTWQVTALTLTIGRGQATATLLPNGQVLIAGGVHNGGPLSIAELYAPPDSGTWTATTNVLNIARAYHTATLLPNGQVLAAGGFNGGTNSELYNPTNGTWTYTSGSMNAPCGEHTATLLPNGKVLVAGGFNSGTNSELYNPAGGTWANTGALNTGRYAHTATLLHSGGVLVAGGEDNTGNALSSAEVYNPTKGKWTQTSHTMNTARYDHTATLLFNGTVLVAGGYNSGSSAELYDPAIDTWTLTGSMVTERYAHTATLLFNGKVLVTGGYNFASNWLSSAELYDPASGTWTNTGSMAAGRYAHTATLLPNGKVLVTGGINWSAGGCLSSAELYDPASGTWTGTGPLITGRNAHTATLLPNGQVLVAGGINWSGGYLSSSELYDINLGFSPSWQPQITTATTPLNSGNNLVINGSGFRGVSEGSSGNTQDSPADYPVVQLRSVENGQTTFLLSTNWSASSYTSVPVTNLPPGWMLATMFVNGIPGTSGIILFGPNILTMLSISTPAMASSGAQLQWYAPAGDGFQMAWTTSLSPPVVWTTNANIITSTDGTFTFTDPDVINSPARFYRLIQLQ